MIKLENIGKNEVILTLNEKIVEYSIPFGNLAFNTYGEVVGEFDDTTYKLIVRLKSAINLETGNIYLFDADGKRYGRYNVISINQHYNQWDDGYFYYILETDLDEYPDRILDGTFKVTDGNTLELSYTPVNNRFKLNLTNCQSGNVTSNIQLMDLSTNKTRYNHFNLYYKNEILKDLIIDNDLSLDHDKIYFVNGEVYINFGVIVNIPTTSYILYNQNNTYQNEGGIVNNDQNIIPIDWTYMNTNYYVYNNNATYLFDLQSGYYDYEITTNLGEMVLETGKLLIKDTTNTDVTYNNNENNIIYNG